MLFGFDAVILSCIGPCHGVPWQISNCKDRSPNFESVPYANPAG